MARDTPPPPSFLLTKLQLLNPSLLKPSIILVRLLRLILCCVLTLAAIGAEKDDTSYILRPNDTVSLSIYGEPDLSTAVRILKTGESSFPLLGSVKITGMSVAAAATHLRDLYAKDYLVDPKLNLTVADFSLEYVAIFGAAKSPGQVPIPVSGRLDLVTAMSAVGGLAETADVNGIQLVRAAGTSATFSMEAIEGAAGRTQLAGGDRIIVNQSALVGKTVTLLGQVGKPGPISFPLKGKLDLVMAITMAGGLTDFANPKKVSINRKGTVTIVDYKAISQRGDRPYLLQPDDVVTVPERFF
ncbi:MAG: polysaccharide biosynthesis/export family protein [Verrucomicrobiota bacterium]